MVGGRAGASLIPLSNNYIALNDYRNHIDDNLKKDDRDLLPRNLIQSPI